MTSNTQGDTPTDNSGNPHKFVSNDKGDIFCEHCGILTFSRAITGAQTDAKTLEARKGCPIGDKK